MSSVPSKELLTYNSSNVADFSRNEETRQKAAHNLRQTVESAHRGQSRNIARFHLSFLVLTFRRARTQSLLQLL